MATKRIRQRSRKTTNTKPTLASEQRARTLGELYELVGKAVGNASMHEFVQAIRQQVRSEPQPSRPWSQRHALDRRRTRSRRRPVDMGSSVNDRRIHSERRAWAGRRDTWTP